MNAINFKWIRYAVLLVGLCCLSCGKNVPTVVDAKPSVYQVEGRFRAHQTNQPAISLMLLVSSGGELFVEGRKAGFVLFQAAYQSGRSVERRRTEDRWVCTQSETLDSIRQQFNIALPLADLATILYANQDYEDGALRVRFLHRERFTAGLLPKLMVFEQDSNLVAAMRIEQWKARENDQRLFELPKCE